MAEIEQKGPIQGFVGPGTATIPPGQGLHESKDTAVCRLGTRIQRANQVFYYGKVVADTNRGLLVGVDESENCVVDSADYTIAPVAAGSRELTITGANMASFAKDAFRDGELFITDDTGAGYTYGIEKNDASVSTALTLTLYDPLVEALVSAESDIAIRGNMFNNLRTVTGTDNIPSGVVPITIDESVAPYCWIQTWGPCAVLDSGSVSAGEIVVAHTAGDVIIMSVFTTPIVGYCIWSGDTGEHCGVFLQIMP